MKKTSLVSPLRHPFRGVLGARRRYIQSLDGIAVPPRGFGGIEWVLSRGLCRFGRFDVSNIPQARRRQAVLLQAQQWSPFPKTELCAVIDDEAALVWIWDKDKVEREIDAAKLNPRRVTVLPETLLHDTEEEGHRLVKRPDGIEGQIWGKGRLTHSRWWPRPPGLADWNAFLRDGGQPAAAALPVPREIAFLKEPWARADNLQGEKNWRYESAAVMAGFSLLSAMSVWHLIHWAQVSSEIAGTKNRLAELEQRAKPVQEARQQALESRERIEFLRNFDPYPPQTVLQAEIGKRLPKDGTFIKEWDFQSGRLKIVLVSPNKLQASIFVKAYQEAGWFKDVQAPSVSEPNLLALEMTALRLAEVSPELIEGKPKSLPDKNT